MINTKYQKKTNPNSTARTVIVIPSAEVPGVDISGNYDAVPVGSASVEKVRDALTNPEMVKEYLFGTELVTDWKVGSDIIFRGEWEGKKYLKTEGKSLNIHLVKDPCLFLSE